MSFTMSVTLPLNEEDVTGTDIDAELNAENSPVAAFVPQSNNQIHFSSNELYAK